MPRAAMLGSQVRTGRLRSGRGVDGGGAVEVTAATRTTPKPARWPTRPRVAPWPDTRASPWAVATSAATIRPMPEATGIHQSHRSGGTRVEADTRTATMATCTSGCMIKTVRSMAEAPSAMAKVAPKTPFQATNSEQPPIMIPSIRARSWVRRRVGPSTSRSTAISRQRADARTPTSSRAIVASTRPLVVPWMAPATGRGPRGPSPRRGR